jgi:predicted nucleic acid-binding protein
MRRYLLDTGPLAAYLQGRAAALSLISPWIQQREVATTLLSYAEVNEYIRGFPNYLLRYQQLRQMMRAIPPYGLTYSALERYGDIRRQLRPPHGPGLIGDLDTLIAAAAIARNLTLATNDSDFRRISGMNLMLLPRLR